MHEPNDLLSEVPLAERDTIDLAVAPGPGRWCWLIDRNPLFLISGVCMLGGCFLVSNAIHTHAPAKATEGALLLMLVALLAVLNVYELAVIWLGLLLAKTQTLARDTRHLLGLALLLVVDTAFVYNEVSIFRPWVGGLIAAIAAALAVLKAAWIVRSLGIQPTRSAMAVISTALVSLYALPVVVRLLASDGFLSQPHAMLVWGGLGAFAALYALPLRWFTFEQGRHADHDQLQRLVAGGLVALPAISLIGHACALLWVYENAFELVMVSPLLLGMSALILRQHQRLGGSVISAKAASIVVACAIVPGLLSAEELTIASSAYSWLAFSPLRGVLLAAPMLLAWGWWISGRTVFGAAAAAIPLVAASLGHTPDAMLTHARWASEAVTGLLPRSKLQWGAMAISAAFVCLIVGALWSWHKCSNTKTPISGDEKSA